MPLTLVVLVNMMSPPTMRKVVCPLQYIGGTLNRISLTLVISGSMIYFSLISVGIESLLFLILVEVEQPLNWCQ